MAKPRVWPVFVTYAVAIVAILIFSALLALWAVVRFGPEAVSGPSESWMTPGMLLASSVAVEVTLLAAVLIAARPLTLERLRLRRAGLGVRSALVGTVGTLALSEALGLVVKVFELRGWGTLEGLDRAVQGVRGPKLGVVLWALAMLPGVSEELFFRGFMQTRLAQRWRPWVAVLVTAAAFGLVHADPLHAPLAMALGLWLGAVCERSGSLWPAMIAHVANNAVATLESAFGAGGAAAAGAKPTAGELMTAVAVTLCVFAACALLLARTKPQPPPPPPLQPEPQPSSQPPSLD